MLRNCLPALGTTFISLFKDTSLAAAIAVPELTFQARKINVETFRVVEAWLTASVLYVATCLLIAAGLRQLERRFPKFRGRRWKTSCTNSGSPAGPWLQGLLLTIEISAASILFGTILGLLVGIGLTYGKWPVRLPIRAAYVDFIRGTPVLVLILATFYLLTFAGINLTAFEAGLFALSIFCGAHMGEIMRGALQSIPSRRSKRAAPSGSPSRKSSSMCSFRRRCGRSCRSGSTPARSW